MHKYSDINFSGPRKAVAGSVDALHCQEASFIYGLHCCVQVLLMPLAALLTSC